MEEFDIEVMFNIEGLYKSIYDLFYKFKSLELKTKEGDGNEDVDMEREILAEDLLNYIKTIIEVDVKLSEIMEKSKLDKDLFVKCLDAVMHDVRRDLNLAPVKGGYDV